DELLREPGGAETVERALQQIQSVYAAATSSATASAARKELQDLLARVSRLAHWTSFDQAFLRDIVQPYLEEHLLSGPVTCRVSNGDLILRNVLINPAGECRVIDCEQAAPTHFHLEDWFRIGYWDPLPEHIQSRVNQLAGPRRPMALYFYLKQLLFESVVNVPRKAQHDATDWCREIRSALGDGEPLARESYFWPTATNDETRHRTLEAQLFWLTDESWSDRHSKTVAVTAGRSVRLLFHVPAESQVHALRFDPMNAPGLAIIQEFTVSTLGPSERIVWSLQNPSDRSRLTLGTDLLQVEAGGVPPQYGLLAVSDDPQLYLGAVGTRVGVPLRVDVTITYSLDPWKQLIPLRHYCCSQNRLVHASSGHGISADDIRELNPDTAIAAAHMLEHRINAYLSGSLKDTFLAGTTEHFATLEREVNQIKMVQTQYAAYLDEVCGRVEACYRTEGSNLAARLKAAEENVLSHLAGIRGFVEDLLAQLRASIEQSEKTMLRHETVEADFRRASEELAILRTKETQQELQTSMARDAITGHARTIDRLELQLAEATAHLRELEQRLAGEVSQRNAVEASFYWRCTAWLRRIIFRPRNTI
ncbi:MAG: hypothetical protein ACREIA_12085, partial [Opitutaceae bacterium]